ncbi:hypothetical protein D9M68_353960 [compost metagenome]
MALDDDEHVIRLVTLVDQLLAGGEVLEAGGRTDLRLLDARQRVGEQGGVADQVLDEQFLALFAGIDVLEHLAALVGHQAQRFLAGVAAARQLETLAQADQVALLQVEQRAFVDQRMEQAVLDQKQLVAGQQLRQVVAALHAQRGAGGRQPFQQLAGDALKTIDQLIGVGRLLPEKIHTVIP